MKYEAGVVYIERDVVWRTTPDLRPHNLKDIRAVVVNAVGRLRRGGVTGCGVTKVRKVGCLKVAGWCTIENDKAIIQFEYRIGGGETVTTEIHQFGEVKR